MSNNFKIPDFFFEIFKKDSEFSIDNKLYKLYAYKLHIQSVRTRPDQIASPYFQMFNFEFSKFLKIFKFKILDLECLEVVF